jgi:hypothetical protein
MLPLILKVVLQTCNACHLRRFYIYVVMFSTERSFVVLILYILFGLRKRSVRNSQPKITDAGVHSFNLALMTVLATDSRSGHPF